MIAGDDDKSVEYLNLLLLFISMKYNRPKVYAPESKVGKIVLHYHCSLMHNAAHSGILLSISSMCFELKYFLCRQCNTHRRKVYLYDVLCPLCATPLIRGLFSKYSRSS